MLFSIVGHDVKDSLPLRKIHRPAHLARLEQLNELGRLVLAGPNPIDHQQTAGFTGSVVVAEFDSLADAKAWADQDPYLLNGIYQSVEVKPFLKVLP